MPKIDLYAIDKNAPNMIVKKDIQKKKRDMIEDDVYIEFEEEFMEYVYMLVVKAEKLENGAVVQSVKTLWSVN